MADDGAQGLGFSRRHAVARSRSVEGFQGSLRMVAVGPLGIGKRRQSRQGAALRRDAGGGTGEGEGRDRRSGASHRAGLTSLPVSERSRGFANRQGPGLAPRDRGFCLHLKTVFSGPLIADVHPAEAGHPTPAARSEHHDPAEAAAPVAVAPVMAATHATALAAAAGGSFGRDERGGADGGDGGDSENRLADHGSLLVFDGCALTSCLSVGRAIRGVQWRLDKKRAPNRRAKGGAADKFARGGGFSCHSSNSVASRRRLACAARPRSIPTAFVTPCRATARSPQAAALGSRTVSSLQSNPMAIERTFSIIKPDATARNLTGAINAMIEGAGLRIVAQRRTRISREQAETFYAVHRERPFFRELVEFMTSGPVVVQVLEGENAIAKYREIMGA